MKAIGKVLIPSEGISSIEMDGDESKDSGVREA